jgi:hypothetical protein
MNKRYVLAAALGAALTVPAYARAHEGHAHKILGTLTTLQERQLTVKAVDGKTSAVVLNDRTKVLRGSVKITLAELRTGERVVVTAVQTKSKEGMVTMVASEVRVAAASRR